MRTIGKFYRLLVKNETEFAMRKEGHFNVRDLVVGRLPEEICDTPEKMNEVDSIIFYLCRDK